MDSGRSVPCFLKRWLLSTMPRVFSAHGSRLNRSGRAFKLQRVNRMGKSVKASPVRLYLWIRVGRLAGSGG